MNLDNFLNNPELMKTAANILKNPEMMENIQKMAGDPNIQRMMNDPNMLNKMNDPNILSNFGNMMSNLEPGTETNDIAESIENENLNENKYKINELVLINNLKKKEYNNKKGIVISFNNETERYIIKLDNNIQISVKESNCYKFENNIEEVD